MGPLRPLSVFEVNLGNHNKVDIFNVHPDSIKRKRRKRGKGIVWAIARSVFARAVEIDQVLQ